MDIETVKRAAGTAGLVVCGAFHPREEDRVPAVAGRPARSLVMLGNMGPEMWQAFQAAPESGDGQPDSLDRWSRRVIGRLAEGLGAAGLYPFGGPPYHPFVAWAKRAGPVAESPLGILIHPDYGLWHAYRGALAFAEPLDLSPQAPVPRPCDTCDEQPCLSACPVAAFGAGGYDVPACVGHIQAPEGADCLGLGCRARRACPVGTSWHYRPDQARFHMDAFLAARTRVD